VPEGMRRSEVAPNCRTLPVLSLTDRLKHKGVGHGEEAHWQKKACAASVRR
jgi:hypothetical protein